jgi:beta-lactamase class A
MRPDADRTRRAVVTGAAAAALAPAAAQAQAVSPFRAIEAESGARLGVFARDVASRRSVGWRAEERFPTASSFKALLAGVILHRADAGREALDRQLAVPTEILSHSPVTGPNSGRPMTIEALCAAITTFSDNTGANMLLDTVGGPAGFTRAMRQLGDPVTRIDRYELELNEALPGDPRDTTSPAAVSGTAERLLLGRLLKPASRAKLTGWMIESQTGLRRIRAGVPSGWRVADKTGTGYRGTTVDFAVVWPAKGAPIVMATYLTGSSRPLAEREAALAAAAKAAVGALGRA